MTTDVPKVQLEVSMLDSLDLEAKSGCNLTSVLTKELLQDRRLARIIESKDEKAQLSLLRLSFLDNFQQAHDLKNLI